MDEPVQGKLTLEECISLFMPAFFTRVIDGAHVAAGAKRTLDIAPDDDRRDFLIRLEVLQGPGEIIDHLKRQRIQRLGAVERNDSRPAVFGHEQFAAMCVHRAASPFLFSRLPANRRGLLRGPVAAAPPPKSIMTACRLCYPPGASFDNSFRNSVFKTLP